MEALFALMMTNPVLSLCFMFVLVVIGLFLFRKVIEAWLIKKFKLYNEKQIKEALVSSMKSDSEESKPEWGKAVNVEWNELKKSIFLDNFFKKLKSKK